VRPLLIGWELGGFEPPMASHLLLGPPMSFTQTNAITVIYIWGMFRDDTARPKWPMQGGVLGEGGPPIPTQLWVWGSAVSSLSGVLLERSPGQNRYPLFSPVVSFENLLTNNLVCFLCQIFP